MNSTTFLRPQPRRQRRRGDAGPPASGSPACRPECPAVDVRDFSFFYGPRQALGT